MNNHLEKLEQVLILCSSECSSDDLRNLSPKARAVAARLADLPPPIPDDGPVLMGRCVADSGPHSERSTTRGVACAVERDGWSNSDNVATIFESTDAEDRGGFVIELRTGSGHELPGAENLEDGVRLHLWGQEEANAQLRALAKALNDYLKLGPDTAF